MKLKTVQRRWCADAKQKTQTDSDAGGRIGDFILKKAPKRNIKEAQHHAV